MSELSVSIIIPAYNAAVTIAETLDSVIAQTHMAWEALVVDDGSQDETAAIVADYAARDGRIRLIRAPHSGGGAARNQGIAAARYAWLLFLDADDWILPHHLALLTAVLADDPTLDAVHGGWQRVSPDGQMGRANFAPDEADMFPLFARQCAFMIHVCLVRRSLVTAVGGFDTGLSNCQDWDLWQRVARTGARFRAVPQVVALYRSRPGSISLAGERQLRNSLRVITQAHAPDTRLSPDQNAYPDGLPLPEAGQARIRFACWSFGLMLGAEQDARPYLALLAEDTFPDIDPAYVAACLFDAALLPQGFSADGWDTLWPRLQTRVPLFLAAFATQIGAPDLAEQSLRCLELKILEHSRQERPFTVGRSQAFSIEVTHPIPSLSLAGSVVQVRCEVRLEGDYLGAFVLDASGSVAAHTIADQIAADFAWPILCRYFEYHVFTQLSVTDEPAGVTIWRGSQALLHLPDAGTGQTFWGKVCDEIGWGLFLQEFWERPSWLQAQFYDASLAEPPAAYDIKAKGAVTLELSLPLPDVQTRGKLLEVTCTLCGTPLVQVRLPVARSRRLTAHQLRVAATQAAGYGLCPAVVRRALIGHAMAERPSLRACLLSASTYTPFIILAQERTGSILLQRLLDSHPEIFCVGEIFNPSPKLRQTIKKVETPIAAGADPIAYLNRYVFCDYPPETKAVGFRLFYTHARDKAWAHVWPYLRDRGVKVIHLQRRNLLDRYLSLQLAQRSNTWLKLNEASGDYGDEMITLDPYDCFRDINGSQWWWHEADGFFADNPRLTVTYEALVDDQDVVTDEILDFLGLVQQPLISQTKKQRSRPKPQRIANYEALKQWLEQALERPGAWQNRAWLEFFDE